MRVPRASALVKWGFGGLPFAWLGGVAALAIRARLWLGYWPSPSRPDPKSLPFELHHMALSIGFYAMPVALCAGMTVYIFNVILRKQSLDRRPMIAFLTGGSAVMTLFFWVHSDCNWVAWFLD